MNTSQFDNANIINCKCIWGELEFCILEFYWKESVKSLVVQVLKNFSAARVIKQVVTRRWAVFS